METVCYPEISVSLCKFAVQNTNVDGLSVALSRFEQSCKYVTCRNFVMLLTVMHRELIILLLLGQEEVCVISSLNDDIRFPGQYFYSSVRVERDRET
jgi:hypothetical protein